MFRFANPEARNRGEGSRRLMVLLALALLALGSPATAQTVERAYADAGCALRDGERDRVTAILDPVTLELEGGLVVRLAGIVPPSADSDHTIIAEATASLTRLTLGQPITLRYGELDHDRYDRAVAHVFVTGASETWVQAELVANGMAFVSGFPEDQQCLAALLHHERGARYAASRIWAVQMILDAWSDSLRAGGDRFVLVEGQVVSVGRTERTVYLNFSGL